MSNRRDDTLRTSSTSTKIAERIQLRAAEDDTLRTSSTSTQIAERIQLRTAETVFIF
jgi:hypothetical protein